MRKLLHPTAVISLLFLSLSMGGCFWNPPELSLAEGEGGEAESEFAEAEAEGEGGEAESEFAEAEAEGEGGEAESEFAEAEGEGGEAESEFAEAEAEGEGEGEGGEAEASAEGEGGETESAFRSETESVATGASSLTGNYMLEFSKTTGQSACAQFGEILDLKVSANGLMSGYLFYAGSRGGPFSGRVRSNGEWSAIGPDEGYKFEGNISDEEISGNYTAPAPNPTEGESMCEGTLEGFKAPD